MKSVRISSVGSCNPATRMGTYDVLIEYQGHFKYLRAALTDTTANRCIIEGLIAGANALKAPCHVTLVSSAKIGSEKAERGSGRNMDLFQTLKGILAAKGCAYEFSVCEGRGDELRATILAAKTGSV